MYSKPQFISFKEQQHVIKQITTTTTTSIEPQEPTTTTPSPPPQPQNNNTNNVLEHLAPKRANLLSSQTMRYNSSTSKQQQPSMFSRAFNYAKQMSLTSTSNNPLTDQQNTPSNTSNTLKSTWKLKLGKYLNHSSPAATARSVPTSRRRKTIQNTFTTDPLSPQPPPLVHHDGCDILLDDTDHDIYSSYHLSRRQLPINNSNSNSNNYHHHCHHQSLSMASNNNTNNNLQPPNKLLSMSSGLLSLSSTSSSSASSSSAAPTGGACTSAASSASDFVATVSRSPELMTTKQLEPSMEIRIYCFESKNSFI